MASSLIKYKNPFITQVLNGVNLNNVIKGGAYTVYNGSSALNFPNGTNGLLLVFEITNYSIIRQFYFRVGTVGQNDTNWYSRQIIPSESIYGSWTKFTVEQI